MAFLGIWCSKRKSFLLLWSRVGALMGGIVHGRSSAEASPMSIPHE